MNNVALVGFMGTGKTTVAAMLAERLQYTVVDIDAVIEAEAGRAIADIFREHGEPYFRQLEKKIIAREALRQRCVLACGGGAVIDPDNIAALKRRGMIVCLTARPEIIIARTRHHTHRPLLNVPDPRAAIEALLAARQALYAQADHTVDTSDLSPQQVAERIETIVRKGP